MWFSFWPKTKKYTHKKVRGYDLNSCKPYITNLKIQMHIVSDKIDYLPYELNSADIRTLILNQNTKVYRVLDQFCEKYNELIESNEFLFATKKRPGKCAYILHQFYLQIISLINMLINMLNNISPIATANNISPLWMTLFRMTSI